MMRFAKCILSLAIVVAVGFSGGIAVAADAPAPKAKADTKTVLKKAEAPAPAPKVMKVGDAIGTLPTQDMEGKPLDLKDLLNTGVLNVIAFTNSACYSCGAESALLASLKGKHGDKINLVGVVVDISPNSYKVLPDAVKKEFRFVHDRMFKMTPLFGFDSTPATALVKNGKIIDLKSGFKPDESEEFAGYIEKNL